MAPRLTAKEFVERLKALGSPEKPARLRVRLEDAAQARATAGLQDSRADPARL